MPATSLALFVRPQHVPGARWEVHRAPPFLSCDLLLRMCGVNKWVSRYSMQKVGKQERAVANSFVFHQVSAKKLSSWCEVSEVGEERPHVRVGGHFPYLWNMLFGRQCPQTAAQLSEPQMNTNPANGCLWWATVWGNKQFTIAKLRWKIYYSAKSPPALEVLSKILFLFLFFIWICFEI